MFDAERFRALLAARGLSQSALARRVGVSQASIYRLASGEAYGSKHLHRIARELQTSPAYLTGETDDPDEGAAPPSYGANLQLMAMPVAMPSGPALMRMFQALLMTAPAGASRDELARTLAETLPTGLARLQGELLRQGSVFGENAEWPAEAGLAEAPARPQAQRT